MRTFSAYPAAHSGRHTFAPVSVGSKIFLQYAHLLGFMTILFVWRGVDYTLGTLAFVLRNVGIFAVHAEIKAAISEVPCDIIFMPVTIRFLALLTRSWFRVKLVIVFHVFSSSVPNLPFESDAMKPRRSTLR
jgi:hypothetical protein